MTYLYKPYHYDTAVRSHETGLSCPEATRTQQHQKDEADINIIVRNFGVTGVLPASTRVPTYQDFHEIFDFRTALESVEAARESFDALPAALRRELNHDPQKLLELARDPEAFTLVMDKAGLRKPLQDALLPPNDISDVPAPSNPSS